MKNREKQRKTMKKSTKYRKTRKKQLNIMKNTESGKAGYRARARGLGPNNGFACSMSTTGGGLGVQRLSPEFGDDEISADPCRQQGERVRGGLTSNKEVRQLVFLWVQKVAFGSGDRGPQARSVLQGPAVSAAPTRAAAPPAGSVYCACHAKGSQEAICTAPATRQRPAAPTRAAAPPGGSVYCACHAKGSQEAICTAPATRVSE